MIYIIGTHRSYVNRKRYLSDRRFSTTEDCMNFLFSLLVFFNTYIVTDYLGGEILCYPVAHF